MDKRIAILVFWVCLASFANGGDPCDPDQHQVISEGQRSVSYIPGKHDSLLCDNYNIINGNWYRFKHQVGGQLPESCVELFRCGTQAPIWMNGHHPTEVGVTVTRQVCANFGYIGDCCSWSEDILVKRCHDEDRGEDFMVYRLVYPPGCPIAYCAGDKIPCPAGQVYNNQTQKCVELHPQIHNVTLLPPVAENEFVNFYCQVTRAGNQTVHDDGARFLVNFYFDQVLVKNASKIITAPDTRVAMDEKWLRFNLGKSLSCGVQSYWVGYSTERSEEEHSNSYFAGILVEPESLTVRETDDKPSYIQLKSTLPITCKNSNHRGRCEIAVKVVTPTRLVAAQGVTLQGYTECYFRISRESWRANESMAYNTSEPLEVTVKRDAYIHDASSHYINFEPISTGVPDILWKDNGSAEYHPIIWDAYDINDVRVSVEKDDRMGTCHSTSDPRMRTWDNGGYDILHRIGEFVMWRSSASRHFEVHVRHWLCREAWFVACTCGVAVREGNTVLAVDMCGGRYKGTPRPKVTQLSDGELKGASVTRDVAGSQFAINMPSGAYVKMDVHDWGMNLYAYAPSEDINKTSGLCGTFDGIPGNDFIMQGSNLLGWREEFIESWRIPQGESLFDKPPEWLPNKQQNLKYCKCLGRQHIECDWTERVDPMQDVGKPTILVKPLKSKFDWSSEASRRRRSLRLRRDTQAVTVESDEYTDDIDEEEHEFDYGFHELPDAEYKWPTRSGLLEEFARNYCKQILRGATSYNICYELLGEKVMEPLERCVDDIKMMDDLAWARNAVGEMEYQCLTTSMAISNGDGVFNPRLAPQNVVKFMCPNQCNARGRCLDGVCLCYGEYDGADCSLIRGRAPQIQYLPNDGLCDVTIRPCLKTRVVASYVKDSPDLVCRVRQVEIDGDDQSIINQYILTNATMISAGEIACDLPVSPVRVGTPATVKGSVAHGLLLSVSNDGVTFSAESFMTIYDSTCMECQKDGNCARKYGACYINGHCFAPGEANPDNWCQVCDPTVTKDSFVTRTNNENPHFSTPKRIVKVPDEQLEMYIGAYDPEGRNVSFVLEFITNREITVDNNGLLRWYSGRRTTVRMELSVYDECSGKSTESFELAIIDCRCQNGGSCVQDPSMPPGQGHYFCECADGFEGSTCAQEINECLSNPCIHGECHDLLNRFECRCGIGYEGDLCNTITPVTINRDANVSTGQVGVWSSYGPYSECSLRCDYGIQSRRRVCERLPCTGPASETKVCNPYNCPENERERPEGILLKIRDTSISQVRIHENDLLATLTEGVNNFCLNKENECCRLAGLNDGNLRVEVFRRENFYFAGGYPKELDASHFILKLIGMMDREYLRAQCLELTTASRKSTDHFIPPEELRDAVIPITEDILQLYGVVVDEVLMPGDEPTVVDEVLMPDDEPTAAPKGFMGLESNTQWVIVACVTSVVLIVIIIVVTVCCIRKHSKKYQQNPDNVRINRNANRSNSMKFLTQNDQLQEIQDTPSKVTDPESKTDSKLKELDQFYFPPKEKSSTEEKERSEPPTAASTIRGEYYYQYAINEGLGTLDKVDSSQLSLHTPAECDRVSIDGLREPPILFSSPETVYPTDPGLQPGPFTRGPKRLSTRKNDNVFAWKLFNARD